MTVWKNVITLSVPSKATDDSDRTAHFTADSVISANRRERKAAEEKLRRNNKPENKN